MWVTLTGEFEKSGSIFERNEEMNPSMSIRMIKLLTLFISLAELSRSCFARICEFMNEFIGSFGFNPRESISPLGKKNLEDILIPQRVCLVSFLRATRLWGTRILHIYGALMRIPVKLFFFFHSLFLLSYCLFLLSGAVSRRKIEGVPSREPL